MSSPSIPIATPMQSRHQSKHDISGPGNMDDIWLRSRWGKLAFVAILVPIDPGKALGRPYFLAPIAFLPNTPHSAAPPGLVLLLRHGSLRPKLSIGSRQQVVAPVRH